ncbi:MAG: GntR family transcriptional regulator [Spirochaetales bacterium]|nr:GntR family transcriptional regulator [Spirochaetales bacterium]
MKNNIQSLKTKIYGEILKKIVSNEFPPDELLYESQLIKMFNVSRAPVREALIELCSANIIRNIPRAGYQIVRISEKDIRNISQFRLILEVEGLKLGFPKITSNIISNLKTFAGKSEEVRNLGFAKNVVGEKMKLNSEFHIAINSICGNNFITEALRTTLDSLWRGLMQIMIHENHMPIPESTRHSSIVKYLEKGDLENAITELTNDILISKNISNGF